MLEKSRRVKSNNHLMTMWLIVIIIMCFIFTSWLFFLKYHFSKTKLEPKESTKLKNIKQEFNQIFSGFKEFRFGEILKKIETNVTPGPSTDSGQNFSTKEKGNLNEKEIEELREKLFD